MRIVHGALVYPWISAAADPQAWMLEAKRFPVRLSSNATEPLMPLRHSTVRSGMSRHHCSRISPCSFTQAAAVVLAPSCWPNGGVLLLLLATSMRILGERLGSGLGTADRRRLWQQLVRHHLLDAR